MPVSVAFELVALSELLLAATRFTCTLETGSNLDFKMSSDHLWFENFLPKGSIHCKDESVNVCGEVGHGHAQLRPLLGKLGLNPDLKINMKDMFVSEE